MPAVVVTLRKVQGLGRRKSGFRREFPEEALRQRFEFAPAAVFGRTLQILAGLRVVQGKEQRDGMAGLHPRAHGRSLGRDFRHLDGVVDVPVAVQIVAERVETYAAARHAVGVAEREDLPHDGLSPGARFGIIA